MASNVPSRRPGLLVTAPPDGHIVWVLGAGFSAPLGGPLLPNLLSGPSEKDVLVRYPAKDYDQLHDQTATDVRFLYEYGQRSSELLWRDAEEFLDYLDVAAEKRAPAEKNPHEDRLRAVMHEAHGRGRAFDAKAVRASARRLIAGECCAFLEGADISRERWQPFRRWARSLTAMDTIISFNYDRVVERLSGAQNADAAHDQDTPPCPIHVVTPGGEIDLDSAPLLKLHGSVDWQKHRQLRGTAIVNVHSDERFALTCDGAALAIATPGPSKKRDVADLDELWRLAKQSLAGADAIVFVGYRFPEADADAREHLLGAIAENGAAGGAWDLVIHTVLGNSVQSARDTERLTALLRFACKRHRREGARPAGWKQEEPRFFRIHSHPLAAQDFFSVAKREQLFG